MRKAFVLLSCLLMLLAAALPALAQNEPRIWTGVFTAAQAERGKANVTTSCVRCHGQDLGGGTAPSLSGARFMSAWENENLYRLFVKIRDTMPPNFGTSLTDEAKLDVVSYILQVNKFPTGPAELKIDAPELEGISIVPKGAGTAVPNFALVRVVGCMAPGPNNTWNLTNTTDPAATRDESSTPEGLKAAEAQPLGNQTFRLVSVAGFKPELHTGHKMEAKGLLYRDPSDARLNLTSLQMVSTNCYFFKEKP